MIRNVLNIPLQRKKEDISTYFCSIGKAVELPKKQFERFKNNLLYDYDFIQDNQEVMTTDNMNIKQCLLVLGEGQDDGILVYSEGQPYASQSAYLPQARTLWRLIQYPELDDFNARMERIVEKVVRQAVERNQDGVFRLLIDELRAVIDGKSFDDSVFVELLSTRPEIDYVEMYEDEIVIDVVSEYVHTEDNEYRPLTQREVDVICAKHALWLLDEGGERAVFSGCELRDMDLRCKPLTDASFDDAKIIACRFEKNAMNGISAEGAIFSDCSFYDSEICDATLRNTRFYNTQFTATQITRSNLTNALLQGCVMSAFDFKECCLQGVEYDNTARNWIGTNDCVEDEEWWLDHYRPESGMTM